MVGACIYVCQWHKSRNRSFKFRYLTGNTQDSHLICSIDDYDPIVHLNAIFSHPSTLSSVNEISQELQIYQDQLDAEIEDLGLKQSATDAECIKRIQASNEELAELFKKIENVR